MSTSRSVLAVGVAALILSGCSNRPPAGDENKFLHGLRQIALVDSPELSLRWPGEHASGGIEAKLLEFDKVGVLLASRGVALPSDLSDSMAQKVQTHLRKAGCTITGGGTRAGLGYSGASGVTNADVQWASVRYSRAGFAGTVDVIVIGRDYQVGEERVVGQVLLIVREAR